MSESPGLCFLSLDVFFSACYYAHTPVGGAIVVARERERERERLRDHSVLSHKNISTRARDKLVIVVSG